MLNSLQNPIEPSMGLDGIDSRINMFKPMCQNVKTSTHDLNSVPRTQYQLKNPLYDTEYISVRDIPSLFPEEDSYDYKYLSSPLYKYLTGPSTQESGISINLLAIKKTSVFDYGFPTYKSPYSSDSVWIHGSKIPDTVFEDPQSVESDPDTLRVSSPTVKIVKLLPETSKQDSIITTTKNDELDYKTTQETPTEAELYPTTSEELRTEDEPSYITTEETMTEDKSNPVTSEELRTEDEPSYITTEETLTEDKSNSIITEETKTEDESNSLVLKEDSTKEESIFTIIEETLTEDKSNPITSEEFQTEDESSFLTTEETLIEDKSNPITSEQFQTEDESSFLTTEGTQTEVDSNSIEFNSIKTEDKSNPITTDENQQEDDESMSMTSQETTTDFNLNDALDTNRFSHSSIILRINDLMKKIKDQQNKSQFRTVDESINQQFEPQLANGADMYEEY